MKNEINLLPEDLKTLRTVRVYLAHSVQASRMIFVSLVLIALILTSIGGAYQFLAASAAEQMSAENTEAQTLREHVTDLNARLTIVNTWQQKVQPWSEHTAEVLAVLPSGVRISGLAVTNEGTALSIRGVFDNREGLLAYQRALEGLAWVEHIEAPLSNFQTGGDQEFTFSLQRAVTRDGASNEK